ncbi:SHOCT domain-containing protein [Pseudoalteromonas nigrifaciens]|uniref:SHOCT domain-containing protein n=1 Tax=Pseudoalteromonas nigrifaciens TaxID=28109 RepID=UPI003FD32681
MPAMSKEEIKEIIASFIPESIQSNIFVKSLLAGATAIGILLAVPAFAPLGVVGATGWIIVYAVTGGTFTVEAISKAWTAWKNTPEDERKETDDKLKALKKMADEGTISEAEYKKRVQDILDKVMS